MKYSADLHVHSKYSRATAKNLDLENLWVAAQRKGITVVGTGDFTHPGWFAEIKEKLVPAEEGLYALQEPHARSCLQRVPASCRRPVRFVLESEISNVYKKKGQTRKNHNLVFAPDVEVARQICARLERIGNIGADGRPILGLDARNLLELVLDQSAEAFLVPAHIWTPWFSVLGSKSGFDSVQECYEDLTDQIFAVETGLSSDPEMNWRVSALDRFVLISNSDAHSPQKLGREANLFDTELSYPAIRRALADGDRTAFAGTFEFYPQEGKYHLDGHRKCGVCQLPEQTRALREICPKCGKPLTVGVLYRVEELADRHNGEKAPHASPFYRLIPLEDLLAEIFMVGPAAKQVTTTLDRLLCQLGPELDILHCLPIDEINRAGIPLLGEAIRRMRDNQVHFSPGFDGQFGKVRIFDPAERSRLLGQKGLFAMPVAFPLPAKAKSDPNTKILPASPLASAPPPETAACGILLNPAQQRVVSHAGGPLIVVAGPGTGKTRTLTQRIFHLIQFQAVRPDHILAVTFTRKAAQEMSDRLARLLGTHRHPPWVATFHALCLKLLMESAGQEAAAKWGLIAPEQRLAVVKDALALLQSRGTPAGLKAEQCLKWIVAAKQRLMGPQDPPLETVAQNTEQRQQVIAVYAAYQELLALQRLWDHEDLIRLVARRLETDAAFLSRCRDRFCYVFVDEYQDLNEGQYRLIKALCPPDGDLCVIGDPDQAIYGFRGSDVAYFNRFVEDFPKAEVIHLTRNYRSTETILESAGQVIQSSLIHLTGAAGPRITSGIQGTRTIAILRRATEKAEAVAIGRIIEQLVGGTGYQALDFGRLDASAGAAQKSFSDFAILYRTHDQGKVIGEVLQKAGIPCQIASRKNRLAADGLAELLCLFRVVEGCGTYPDFENLARTLTPGLSKSVVAGFKVWAYEKRLTLTDAIYHGRRIPIPSLSRTDQHRLVDFLNMLGDLGKRLQNCTISQKLEQLAALPALPGPREVEWRLQRLIDRGTQFNRDAVGFLASLALDSDTDHYEAQAEKVALMTMHAAKGLEFPIVFIAGCEAGSIPLEHTPQDPALLDEERRLFYVAMTRAKERLYLTWAQRRLWHGRVQERQISPFVLDIEKSLQEHLAQARKKRATPPEPNQTQLSLF